jgi:hypothetical protein
MSHNNAHGQQAHGHHHKKEEDPEL